MLRTGSQSILVRLYSSMKVKIPVKQGIVVGQQQKLPGGLEYNSFLGVPYAEPPVGNLRFRSPVPQERFEQPELDCSKERNVSHQRDPFTTEVAGSENCLFLNVYAPKSRSSASPLPVMVWIHGGGFFFGNGNSDFHFPAKLMEQDVIVVTLNYRLGALGFLSLPEEGIWGNMGLKDQRMALQWVQENIASFNGDPNNVTLFGESAGGSSVHLHTYARHAHKLFHKAIMQSGTGNMEWVFQQDAAYKTRRLAELLGGGDFGSNTKDLLAFLLSEKVKPIGILANTMKVLTADERRRHLPFAFKPVVEDASSPDSFIDQNILDLMHKKDHVGKMPMIMGYNSAEGLAMIVRAKSKLEEYEQDLARTVPRDLVPDPQAPEAQQAAADIRNFYFNGQALVEQHLDSMVDLFSDYHFSMDLQNAVEIHANCQTQSPVYFYRLDYVGGRNLYKQIFQNDNLRGVAHADDICYVFQTAGDASPMEKEDALVSERIAQMWANFARHGKPSDSWTPVQKPQPGQATQLDCLLIDRECRMQKNPDAERMDFWRSMYKRYSPQCYVRAKL
ncbi:juvenile hormone esterase [Drosophila obscura]|uniref:juvenile hormone esterase n=1 Tax=Drosophila obscura TaxID=7282 RepID=UPI001BB2CDF5|nr:juvenile hormone esterase [Drosophila obscura]